MTYFGTSAALNRLNPMLFLLDSCWPFDCRYLQTAKKVAEKRGARKKSSSKVCIDSFELFMLLDTCLHQCNVVLYHLGIWLLTLSGFPTYHFLQAFDQAPGAQNAINVNLNHVLLYYCRLRPTRFTSTRSSSRSIQTLVSHPRLCLSWTPSSMISLTRLPMRPQTWPATTRSQPSPLVRSRLLFVSSFQESFPSTLFLREPRLSPSSPPPKYSLLGINNDWIHLCGLTLYYWKDIVSMQQLSLQVIERYAMEENSCYGFWIHVSNIIVNSKMKKI